MRVMQAKQTLCATLGLLAFFTALAFFTFIFWDRLPCPPKPPDPVRAVPFRPENVPELEFPLPVPTSFFYRVGPGYEGLLYDGLWPLPASKSGKPGKEPDAPGAPRTFHKMDRIDEPGRR